MYIASRCQCIQRRSPNDPLPPPSRVQHYHLLPHRRQPIKAHHPPSPWLPHLLFPVPELDPTPGSQIPSSFQYRNLIPLLAHKYHVLAPDFPGFGFTTVPSTYTYTFANLTKTLAEFLDALAIETFAVYIFDYGAPIGLRLALQRPTAVKAIITQNGNAYVEGLGAFWDPFKKYWLSGSYTDREALRSLLTLDSTKLQYEEGEPHPETIDPVNWTLDYALISKDPEVQLDLFFSYRTNVALYPEFQAWFRKSQVPTLVAWGANDVAFVKAGAEAFKRDLPHAEVKLLDAGHFASVTHTAEIAELILEFLKDKEI